MQHKYVQKRSFFDAPGGNMLSVFFFVLILCALPSFEPARLGFKDPQNPFRVTEPLLTDPQNQVYNYEITLVAYEHCSLSSESESVDFFSKIPKELLSELISYQSKECMSSMLATSKNIRGLYAECLGFFVDSFNLYLRNANLLEAVVFKTEFFDLFKASYPALKGDIPVSWEDVLALTCFAFFERVVIVQREEGGVVTQEPGLNEKDVIIERKIKALEFLLLNREMIHSNFKFEFSINIFSRDVPLSTNIILGALELQFPFISPDLCYRYIFDAIHLKEQSVDYRNRIPFIVAASACGHYEFVKKYIDMGTPLNSESEFCKTPLYEACVYDHVEVAKLLLNSGAPLNDITHLPLSAACYNGNLELIELLIRAGANIDGHFHCFETPLRAAFRGDSFEALTLLRGNNVHLDPVDIVQFAFIWMAAKLFG